MSTLKLRGLFALLSCFSVASAQNNYKEVTLPQLLNNIQKGYNNYVILDVRTKGEYYDTLSNGKHLNIGRIKGAINIPLQDLQQKPDAIHQLDGYKDKEIYVVCSHSYRSRTISNLLLQNGFTNITNIRGGMSEWFRNYTELQPYVNQFYEKHISYQNISPAQLFAKMQNNEPIQMIGFSNNPRSSFDTMVVGFLQSFPDFKQASYFKVADSMQVLEKAKASKGKTIITFNTVGMGGGEAADFLTRQGITNVYYLVGNLTGFYEYLVNYQSSSDPGKYMALKSKIQYYTPLSYCRTSAKNTQLVDMRHDTIYNKTIQGTKLSYKHIKGAANFPYYKSVEDFVSQFPDKTKEYVLLAYQGYNGSQLANDLLAKGYRVGWLLGSTERWEWYTNNIETFACKDYFVQ